MDIFTQVIGVTPTQEFNDIVREQQAEFELSLSSEGLQLYTETMECYSEIFDIADANVIAKVKQEVEDAYKRPKFSAVNSLRDLRTLPKCDTEMVMANKSAQDLLEEGVIDGYGEIFDESRLERIRQEVESGVSVNGSKRKYYRTTSPITKDAGERREIRRAWKYLEFALRDGEDGTSRYHGLL